MQITYAGSIIAQEPDFGGFDAVQGFDPDSTPVTDWSEPLRAANAIPLARSNVKTTISGTVMRATEPTLGAALMARALQYAALPPTGDLVLQVGANTVTYYGAVKGPGKLSKAVTHGVSWGYDMIFYAGAANQPPASDPAAITDSTGSGIEDSTGTPIESTGT